MSVLVVMQADRLKRWEATGRRPLWLAPIDNQLGELRWRGPCAQEKHSALN